MRLARLGGLLLSTISAFALAGCGGEPPNRLEVYAAASLRDALGELGAAYRERSGVEPVLNLGSSGTLAVQIELGGRADVFLSAGEREMDELERRGRLVPGTRRVLLSNQLAVIVPRGGASLARPADLAGDWLERLSVADTEGVPAGRYARRWLESVGLWERVRDRILPGVDVRAALAAVEYGGAQAGIVYRTDAVTSDEVEIAYAVPLEEGPRIEYPVAALAPESPFANGAHAAEATSFLAFLAEPRSLAVFERHGFLIAPEPR